MRTVGTCVRGIRTPIIKKGDNLVDIVVKSVIDASTEEGFQFHDKDIVAVTEAVVAISEGNYATVDDIAADIKSKFPGGHIGLINPILSRNRFSLILKGIARGCKKITILLSFPSDEVGNEILDHKKMEYCNISLNDTFDNEIYSKLFGDFLHPFTGINMVDFYRDLVLSENCEVDFIFSNSPEKILNYTKDVLVANIHSRSEIKNLMRESGAKTCFGLDDILTKPVSGSGFNEKYGLLGSNKSSEDMIKLFPRTGKKIVEEIQDKLLFKTNVHFEVMVYGDGCFKDPIGHIWELADPVVSPAYTSGLIGTPNELKLKYLSDNKFSRLTGEILKDAIIDEIRHKDSNLVGKMETQGTTPRRLTDLIGSLCDLTSGSGDKGTPVVLVQGYFDNLATN